MRLRLAQYDRALLLTTSARRAVCRNRHYHPEKTCQLEDHQARLARALPCATEMLAGLAHRCVLGMDCGYCDVHAVSCVSPTSQETPPMVVRPGGESEPKP